MMEKFVDSLYDVTLWIVGLFCAATIALGIMWCVDGKQPITVENVLLNGATETFEMMLDVKNDVEDLLKDFGA